MPNLLAMSFEGELDPSFDLRLFDRSSGLPDGWGIGYYPGGESAAAVLKESAPRHGSPRREMVKAYERFDSSVFVAHVRTATWGAPTAANTQPFLRSWGGRDWLFAHGGSLRRRPTATTEGPFTPVGASDTELVFCELLNRAAAAGWKSLDEADPQALRAAFADLNQYGSMTAVLSDGRDLVVYADAAGEGGLYVWRAMPPGGSLAIADDDVAVSLAPRQRKARKGVVVASTPLAAQDGGSAEWNRLAPGGLAVVRQGGIRAELFGESGASTSARPSRPSRALRVYPRAAEVRRFSVTHATVYRYANPVRKSVHVVRLTPVHDRLQTLVSHELRVSSTAPYTEYDDVFGNRVRRFTIETPFTELAIEARSTVELLDAEPIAPGPRRLRAAIPYVWMPWQRHMLEPYLLPAELPESELAELAEYAMSFAERNGYDLLDTLLDINATIYGEYAYRPGATGLSTSAFDVYSQRRGVCQDFANLFICLARLLGVPARYSCGYVYVGPQHANQAQAEATHAWGQVYLPQLGWKGFDPTNGSVTQTEHIRMAVGRAYIDATPTMGTIFAGGEGAETLEVIVRVEPLG